MKTSGTHRLRRRNCAAALAAFAATLVLALPLACRPQKVVGLRASNTPMPLAPVYIPAPSSNDTSSARTAAATLQPTPVKSPARDANKYQCGESSYYGNELAGAPTATGEPFNPQGMTAAHVKLGLGTTVKVVNTQNNKSVIVKINDRGPYAGGRILDLSEGAFQKIASISSGTAQVCIYLNP